ncbi:MAG TPA: hypothetical protein DCM05_02275 [Elusimicrobia bacterium]|nr:hypothetical protein [Elusimicrobiota bacterium]
MRRGLLLAALLPLQACLYTHHREKAALAPQERAVSGGLRAGDILADCFVYRSSELPLSAFFRRLAKGEFDKALQSIRLRYEPSAHDGKAMKALLKARFVPVLVRARNEGSASADLGAVRWTLHSADGVLDPIPPAELPKALEGVHWPAVAANVYNTTVVVVGYTAVLAAIAATVYYGGNGPIPAEFLSLPERDAVWNPVKKTLDLDYQDFLLRGGTLAPGESRQGLLFFRLKGKDWGGLALQAG